MNGESREEVGDFDGGRFRSVGAVNGVGVDAFSEVGADRAGGGLLRVRGTHELTVLENGASPSRTWIMTGPDVMKETRSLKKGRSL